MNQENLNIEIEQIVEKIGNQKRNLIPILQAIQKKYNYLPGEALKRLSEISDISPAKIYGVSTFYTQFRHSKMGDHIIQVCTGTACHIKGAEQVYDAFLRELKISKGLDTDSQGKYTVQKVACLGCCTIAPVVQIDDITFGKVSPEGVAKVLKEFSIASQKVPSEDGTSRNLVPVRGEVKIGLGSCCIASGSKEIQKALASSMNETGISTKVKSVGCVGMCHKTPLLEISEPGKEPVFYEKVQPHEVKKILLNHFKSESFFKRFKNKSLDFIENKILTNDSSTVTNKAFNLREKPVHSFLGKQVHITTEYSGQIDPLDLEEYLSGGGFTALHQTLNKNQPLAAIDLIKKSGLRGRGGGGFPTGTKLGFARSAPGEVKYLICNGDEGDPGAFMDRMILESYPFRVIEGMLLLAYMVGVKKGFFYIRAEYPLAVKRLQTALEIAREAGLLGNNIQNTGFSMDFEIIEGAGAFVCGEETAMIASIEGNRGNPRFRPPFPAESGLWGHPTLVNNCETIATIPWIIRNGPEAFTKLGTEKSTGTKVFSLAGKVKRGGLIEVPMGITIGEIVEDIGGGIEGEGRFKAVQVGGPSGGCIPAKLNDIRIDYEELTRVGAMMGSGGLLVMDKNDCMVEIARYFLEFTCSQSCGKCTHCRVGTRMMLELLENLCAGKGKKNDLKTLEEIAISTQNGSLCGLGKTSPNPVLTTLKYFREEYEAHLEGCCPAGYCKSLIKYSINDKCIGCTLCAQACPTDAIQITPYQKHKIEDDLCTKCGSCLRVCPNEAVEKK